MCHYPAGLRRPMTLYWSDGKLGQYWLDQVASVDGEDFRLQSKRYDGPDEEVVLEGQLSNNGDGTWTIRWSDGTEETLISTRAPR